MMNAQMAAILKVFNLFCASPLILRALDRIAGETAIHTLSQ